MNFTKQHSHNGFTLMEIMLVVIVLGVIASLALSNYNKVVEQGYCRNAQMNLIAIQSAAIIYHLRTHSYQLSGTDIIAINKDLKLNIKDPKFTYELDNPNGLVSITATRKNGPTYKCQADSTIPLKGNNINPVCNSADFCQSVLP